MKKEAAPGHLTSASKAWYVEVVTMWDLDTHHRHLLTNACECLDRIAEARHTIQSEGAYFTDKKGAIRPHPALNVEVQNRTLFARLLRELALDVEPPPEAKRPPLLKPYLALNYAQKK